MSILIFILSGLLSGFLAGLLGIGGGVVTVPVLFYAFSHSGYPEGEVMQAAISTSLAATFVTTFFSTWAHHQKRGILFSTLKYLVPGLFIGCVSGAFLVVYLPGEILKDIFGIMAILFAIYFFFPRLPNLHIAASPNPTLGFFGLAIGCLSSLLGVGGGIFTLPVLFGYQLSMKNAVATSSAATLATAFAGSVTYLIIAWNKPFLPMTFGYIEIPAFIAISLGSVSTTWLGVHLSHTLPTVWIKRIFACALGATGIAMLIR